LALISIAIIIISYAYMNQYEHERSLVFPLSSSDHVIQNAISYLQDTIDVNGTFADLGTTSWIAMALSAADEDPNEWKKTQTYLIESTTEQKLIQASDWERHTLALISFDIDPYNVNGINCIEHILSYYDNHQIGEPSIIHDDIFGILALRSAGISKENKTIQQVQSHIINQQERDGGWGDVDTSAAAIMALIASGENQSSEIIQEGRRFLRDHQTASGGFTSWGSTNTATTSWVLCSLSLLEEDPLTEEWMQQENSAISYLISMQNPDGSFLYTTNTELNPVWMTAYAMISLTGNTFFINSD